jgi:hypothetical protein
MQLVTAQFLLAKWRLLASPLEASPAPLEASFRALVRQSEAMSSFVMERDALCASDRVSLWKITLFASVNLRHSKVIKRRPYSYVSSLTLLKAMHCAVAAGRACSFEDHFIKPGKA